MDREKVEKVLEEMRMYLQADGGDVELIDVSPEGVVKVRLKGACLGCPMAIVTLKSGIERFLKRQIPDIKEVIAID